MNYMVALHELINGFLLIAIVPHRLLRLPFLPNIIKKKGYALQDYLSYTQELLMNERAASVKSSKPRNNMLSLLATISQRSTKDELIGTQSPQSGALSEDDVTGNLYISTLAGYDTTANTLAYTAATTLATLPEWQDWIIEEIDREKKEVGEKAGNAEIFPKLKRCLALMVRIAFNTRFRKRLTKHSMKFCENSHPLHM
jgi:cytochrome P450